jgi:hypothetical protein
LTKKRKSFILRNERKNKYNIKQTYKATVK